MRRPGVHIDASALEAAMQPGLDNLIDKAMAAGVESAQDLVPVKTGALHDDIGIIEPASDGEGAYGVESLDYGVHVEFGTQRMAAQPYLRPSIDAMKKVVQ